jgi:hypothetical protein
MPADGMSLNNARINYPFKQFIQTQKILYYSYEELGTHKHNNEKNNELQGPKLLRIKH